MAKPRIFLSSTCYDLGIIRSELRPYIQSMGYEPIMSDYSDILYDPDLHSHESCIKQIVNCDLVVLIIGSRFGGKVIPSALKKINFSKIRKMSSYGDKLPDSMSITQAEVVTALDNNIPIYPFIDHKVYHEQYIYQKNKNQGNDMTKFYFPSIEKQDTARYIFDFIGFIRGLQYNNGIYEFATIADIRNQLTTQWAAYFKELLRTRNSFKQNQDMERDLSRRFNDLKEAIFSSIEDTGRQDKIRKITKYRTLISFVAMIITVEGFKPPLLISTSWDDLIVKLGIVTIKEISIETGRRKVFVIRKNDYYRCHYSIEFINKIKTAWESFFLLKNKDKKELIEAFSEKEIDQQLPFTYFNKNFDT
jgi:hypothetical protein